MKILARKCLRADSAYKGPYVSDAIRRAGMKPGERRQNEATMLTRRPGPSSSGHLNLSLCAGNTGVVGPSQAQAKTRPSLHGGLGGDDMTKRSD
jgi:hypothetical protein